MANFIGLVYATLKEEGIDTSKLSTGEAVDKFKELQEKKGNTSGSITEASEKERSEEPNKVNDKEIKDMNKDEFVEHLNKINKTNLKNEKNEVLNNKRKILYVDLGDNNSKMKTLSYLDKHNIYYENHLDNKYWIYYK